MAADSEPKDSVSPAVEDSGWQHVRDEATEPDGKPREPKSKTFILRADGLKVNVTYTAKDEMLKSLETELKKMGLNLRNVYCKNEFNNAIPLDWPTLSVEELFRKTELWAPMDGEGEVDECPTDVRSSARRHSSRHRLDRHHDSPERHHHSDHHRSSGRHSHSPDRHHYSDRNHSSARHHYSPERRHRSSGRHHYSDQYHSPEDRHYSDYYRSSGRYQFSPEHHRYSDYYRSSGRQDYSPERYQCSDQFYSPEDRYRFSGRHYYSDRYQNPERLRTSHNDNTCPFLKFINNTSREDPPYVCPYHRDLYGLSYADY